jgi:hypothetical protein
MRWADSDHIHIGREPFYDKSLGIDFDGDKSRAGCGEGHPIGG